MGFRDFKCSGSGFRVLGFRVLGLEFWEFETPIGPGQNALMVSALNMRGAERPAVQVT